MRDGGDKKDGAAKRFTEIKSEKIDKITKSPTFLHRPITSEGKEFFYFRKIGDNIQGFLGRRIDNTVINRACSFIIETDHGPEEFFANKLLQQLLFELNGEYVKIEYIGDQQTQYGHRRKVYRVYKAAGTGKAMNVTGETETTKNRKAVKEHDGKRPNKSKRTRPDRQQRE